MSYELRHIKKLPLADFAYEMQSGGISILELVDDRGVPRAVCRWGTKGIVSRKITKEKFEWLIPLHEDYQVRRVT